MAFDAFLKIDGVDGESLDDAHIKWIEILSFSWGASRPASAGQPAGKVVAKDFNLFHKVDKASPILMLRCCDGTHIPSATLSVRKAGTTQLDYLKYKMENVIISGFAPGGSSSGADDRPLEEISLNFQKMTYSYIYQDPTGAQQLIEATCDFTTAPTSVSLFGHR
jgi:type VI secretion system secreted protein Hcp